MEQGEYLDRDQRTLPKIILKPKHQVIIEDQWEGAVYQASPIRVEILAFFYHFPLKIQGAVRI